jgi:hypothetical protein
MRRLTHEEFVARAKNVHGDTYLYNALYTHSGTPIAITCRQHGEFLQTPNAHVTQRQGCPRCSLIRVAAVSRAAQSSVIAQFINKHGQKYDYSLVAYKGAHSPVRIICPEHGEFKQSPQSHRSGRGCPICAVVKQQKHNSRRSSYIRENFAKLAGAKHKELFDYSKVVYTHNQTTITIRCTKHDLWIDQTARDHLDGYNPCPKCNHMKSSGEGAVSRFLSIFTPVVARDRTLIRPKELDIYLPEHKLAIEYCGEFWHSSGSKEEEAAQRRKHIDKHKACAAAGIRLLTIYESEWLGHNLAIRRLIRNALGKSKGKLMARKCEVREVSHSDARDFYDDYHPQGGEGNGVHYGLFWKDRLVACMRFTFGANDRGKTKRAWTLTRYATRMTVAGGASRLFQAFIREHKPTEVKSFSDNRFFDGGMYKALGFTLEEELGPDYMVWSPKNGLWPKNHYQRRLIPKRLVGHGIEDTFDPETDPRTEADMTYLMGCRRIYDCGKKRWVWRLDTPSQPC